MAMHADAIAKLLFGVKGNASRGLRRRYRRLRSQLNERNGHMADRMLSMKRADELDCSAITAGFFSKSRRALLNLPKTGVKGAAAPASSKRRYDDPSRVDLAERILKYSSKVENIPAPSSIQSLADAMLDMSNDSDAEFSERYILNQTFELSLIHI